MLYIWTSHLSKLRMGKYGFNHLLIWKIIQYYYIYLFPCNNGLVDTNISWYQIHRTVLKLRLFETAWKWGNLKLRFDNISICAYLQKLRIVLEKTVFSHASCEKNPSRFCSSHLVLIWSIQSGFLAAQAVQIPNKQHISRNQKTLQNVWTTYGFSLNDSQIVVFYAVVVSIVFIR